MRTIVIRSRENFNIKLRYILFSTDEDRCFKIIIAESRFCSRTVLDIFPASNIASGTNYLRQLIKQSKLFCRKLRVAYHFPGNRVADIHKIRFAMKC